MHMLGADAEFSDRFGQVVVAVADADSSVNYLVHSAVAAAIEQVMRARSERMRRVLQGIRNEGQHGAHPRRHAPQMVTHLQMAPMDHARASRPELLCSIVCVKHD